MTGIRVPRLNSNDTAYVIVDWLVADGQPVSKGDPVVVLETSKATEEIVATGDGILHHLQPVNAQCTVAETIGLVLEPGARRLPTHTPARSGPSADVPPSGADVLVTGPARVLLDEHGLDDDTLREIGGPVIRRVDVERFLAGRADSVTPGAGQPDRRAPDAGQAAGIRQALPPGQQAVARAVTTSHQTIPAAFTVVAVQMDAARALAVALTHRLRRMVGTVELAVLAIARQHTRFPLCFATALDASCVRLAPAPHVAVTVDVGHGLYTPVVRDAADRSVDEIAQDLARFRAAAGRGDFRSRELTGAAITLTVHSDPGTVLAVPLVPPDQVCALSLAASRPELVLDGAGRVTSRRIANLGLAYDHRVVNGSDAMAFLGAVRSALEDPATLTPDDGGGR